MALLPPGYLDAVVAIGTKKKNEIIWNGTGFFYIYKRKSKETTYLFLITNKHIIDNAVEERKKHIFLKLNRLKSSESVNCEINLFDDNNSPLYMNHPKGVDISIIELNYSKFDDKINMQAFLSDKTAFTIDELRDSEVTEGDDVFVLGFPMGNVGIKRKSTIVRKGCIARISDVINHENNEMLLDALIFPGNSGGPVILKPNPFRIKGTKAHKNAVLIGIINEYLSYEDIAKSEQTGHIKAIFTDNSGLASAFPVDFINQVIVAYLKGEQ